MHYDSLLGGVLSHPIMKTITGESIGINKEMSQLDIQKLNRMYSCKHAASAQALQDEIKLLNEKLENMNAENQRLRDLNQNGGNQGDAQLIEKLKNDKIKLKGHLKVTRDNNGALQNMVDELKTEKEQIEVRLRESNSKLISSTNEIAVLERANEESTKKTEVLEMKAEELEEKIEQLKKTKSKLVSDLESCKSTDVDRVISQRELKECNQDLEAEEKKNRQCESGRTTCSNTLGDQVQLNQNLQERNSDLSKSLYEARSSSSANQGLAQRCQNQLEDEIEEKETLQEKFKESEIKTEELEAKIGKLKTKESQLIFDLENCKRNDTDLVLSEKKTKECYDKLEVASKESLHYQSENDSNQKRIIELKSNQTKLLFDLENLRSTNADPVISKQELKECTEDLEAEKTRYLQCDSDKETCEKELQNEVKRYENLQSHKQSVKVAEALQEEVGILKTKQFKLISDLKFWKNACNINHERENSEEGCQSYLRDQEANFISMIRRYNSLVKSKLHISFKR